MGYLGDTVGSGNYSMRPMELTRRRILAAGCGLMAAPTLALAAAPAHRRLRLQHAHTGERLDVVYFEHGEYLPAALANINRLLRDFRTGEEHPVEKSLLDLLALLFARAGERGAFEVISAFRSSKTNTMLRRNTAGVSERSFHMVGRAVDVRLTSVPTERLRGAALALRSGGVGYYPKSNFVHIDTGPVRAW